LRRLLPARVSGHAAAAPPSSVMNSRRFIRSPRRRARRVGGTATLASIVAKAHPGIRFNEHVEGDGPTVFAHAC
jgi:signal transduction histidine kinase